jgi:SAM-dependent methyltransferase
MIIHKLILQHLRNSDDPDFYTLQADDAIKWLEEHGARLGPRTNALDLGCGHGIFGSQLAKKGCSVTFADATNLLLPELKDSPFLEINLDQENVSKLGEYDLVICSNVLEHLSKPERFLSQAHQLLKKDGVLYLSWTNWLSPWGGHEFSPFHYLGPRLGTRLYDCFFGTKRPRIHTPYVDLFPTSIGQTIRFIREESNLAIKTVSPRYYPEAGLITKIPLVREFLTWNCALMLTRR